MEHVHFIEKCEFCQTVISQCKCISSVRNVIWGVCSNCMGNKDKSEINSNKYSVLIQWSEEDKGFIAIIPEIEGVSSFGHSKEEALVKLEIARTLYRG